MKTLKLLLLCLVAIGCSKKYPNQNPVGQPFLPVQGKALSGEEWKVPEGMKDKPALLLLGYIQDSQFDIDRWLIGLDMTNTQVPVYEIPAIQGLFPRMFQSKIDAGMRSGIPKILWKGVITVYKDGDKLQKFTGNMDGLNARVVLIDKDGVIRFFHDRGFSVVHLNQLKNVLKEIQH